jgi:hypothetical protein
MSKTAKPRLALVLQVKTASYAGGRLVAHVCYVNEDGELRNFLGDRFETGAEYADFTVSCYLPKGDEDGAPYGFATDYRTPYNVELYRAELMVKLLRKVGKGLERLDSERGWLGGGDFAAYALRVAEVLGVRDFYVRNDDARGLTMSSVFRSTDGAGVQMWVEHKVRAATGSQRAVR